MTAISIASACSRVGRLATWSRDFAVSSCPPNETAVVTSLSLSFEKALITRAAAPGSSFEKASTSGPFSTGPKHSNEVPATALRASVFLTTRMYTPAARDFDRSSVICVTVRPRYSAATTDRALDATSLTSVTSAFLSSRLRAIQNLLALKITIGTIDSDVPNTKRALRNVSPVDGDPHQGRPW